MWVWLPGATTPVVAGLLERARGGPVTFTYGRSYLGRADAIALYEPELPPRPDRIDPPDGLRIASSVRDARPDAWGQRVVLARSTGHLGVGSDTAEVDQLTYLLESGSDRIGGSRLRPARATTPRGRRRPASSSCSGPPRTWRRASS